jgi:hypothetical protein
MTTFQIEVTMKDGEQKLYDFAPMEFGVAQAMMQMLCMQENDDDVILWLMNSKGEPTRLTDKAEMRDAMRQQRLQQMSGQMGVRM